VDAHQQVLALALAIGMVFGFVGQRTRFCLTGALRDRLVDGDGRRLSAFLLAAAVAMTGTQALVLAGVLELGGTIYLQSPVSWLLLPFGGFLFGYGMALANGCGARALVLLGTGNLRSLVVLLCLGVSAYATLRGVLAPARLWLAEVASSGGAAVPRLPVWLGLAGALALAVYAFASRDFRASPRDWLGGLLIGVLVPAGWAVTGYLGADPFEPVRVVSLTFVAPVGETLQYLMLATGLRPDFGVMVVAGVPVGALLGALAGGRFRWQGFEATVQMRRYVGGAVLMGVGGALALGCSIGQGLTGVSTLAAGSMLAALAILAGGAVGVRGPLRVGAP
jgi:uncharacterized protein